MRRISSFSLTALATIPALLGFGCASHESTLPPLPAAVPARSPAEIARALPGVWVIDVKASAGVMARAQFQPHQATVLHRAEDARETRETTTVAQRFDASAYREARRYWTDLLNKPDMQWQLTFNADGTGEHRAIVKTGSPAQDTPFTWKLEGYCLNVNYPDNSHFRSFETEMYSPGELDYPMQPLGDHLVLQPQKPETSR